MAEEMSEPVGVQPQRARPMPWAAKSRMHDYVRMLIGDAERLLIQPEDLLQRLRGTAKEWTWSDAFDLERELFANWSRERLSREVWLLRSDYRDLAGERVYKRYLESKPPDPERSFADNAADLVREDCLAVLRALQWLYVSLPAQVRNRDRNMLRLASITGGVIGAATLGVWYYLDFAQGSSRCTEKSIPVLPAVFFAGSVGGLTSVWRRMYLVPLNADPAQDLLLSGKQLATTYLAPVAGAIGAGLLYLIFIGHLLQGELFPTISTPEATAQGLALVRFMKETGPAGGLDFGKLLVWSYVAGFSERFVPDILDRLTARASSSATPTT